MTNNISDYFNSDSVFITGHVNPDGDALGAALALKLYLDSKDLSADINFDITTKLPSNLNHLPYDLISNSNKDKYETAFVFDCGNSSRLGKFENLVLEAKNIIVIDHHVDPSFGEIYRSLTLMPRVLLKFYLDNLKKKILKLVRIWQIVY